MGKISLFNGKLLYSVIERFSFPVDSKKEKTDEIINAWQTAFKDNDLSKAEKTNLKLIL